jgi:hypothetical protein
VWIRPLSSKLIDDRAAFQREAREALVGYLEMSFGPPQPTKVGDTRARLIHGEGVVRGAGPRCLDKVPPLSCHRPVELWALGVRLDDEQSFMINVRIDLDASEAVRTATIAAVRSAQMQAKP